MNLSCEYDSTNDLTDLTEVKTEEAEKAEEEIELPKETAVEEQVPPTQMPQLQEDHELVNYVPLKDEIAP